MPKIVTETHFDGVQRKIERLGLSQVMAELRHIVTGWDLRICEERAANGAAAIRKLIDGRFEQANNAIDNPEERWKKRTAGGIDYVRCIIREESKVCIGVEVQVSARSDLVAVDLLHFNKSLREGDIDLGVLIVPSDRLAKFLPDRCPSVSEAERMLDMFDANRIPLVFWGIEHDGPGDALKVLGRETS